jgi:hypothetical protein
MNLLVSFNRQNDGCRVTDCSHSGPIETKAMPVVGMVTDLVLGHPGIYSNLLELQHTIMYFTTLRRHLTRANAGLSS